MLANCLPAIGIGICHPQPLAATIVVGRDATVSSYTTRSFKIEINITLKLHRFSL